MSTRGLPERVFYTGPRERKAVWLLTLFRLLRPPDSYLSALPAESLSVRG